MHTCDNNPANIGVLVEKLHDRLVQVVTASLPILRLFQIMTIESSGSYLLGGCVIDCPVGGAGFHAVLVYMFTTVQLYVLTYVLLNSTMYISTLCVQHSPSKQYILYITTIQ